MSDQLSSRAVEIAAEAYTASQKLDSHALSDSQQTSIPAGQDIATLRLTFPSMPFYVSSVYGFRGGHGRSAGLTRSRALTPFLARTTRSAGLSLG